MILVTGDCHGDFSKFSGTPYTDLTENDTVIVCGDFGIWDNNAREQNWMRYISDQKYTVVFVDGNHDNFDRLNKEFTVVDFHGGKAHRIRHNLYHLMRGYVFDFEGKKFFCFGGARSHDIQGGILDPRGKSNEQFLEEYAEAIRYGLPFRIRGISWWDRELPSEEEMNRGRAELEKVNWKVDYVITHCLPTDVQAVYSAGDFEEDILTDYLMNIAHKMNFKTWYCGHYHDDYKVMGKYQISYYGVQEVV